MSKNKGKRLNPFQHAYKRPDTYIGSVKTSKKGIWLFDDESQTAVFSVEKFNPGLFNIAREIGSNAVDNKWRSEEEDPTNPVTKIVFRVGEDDDPGMISIWNDGYCIPNHIQEFDYEDPRSGKTITEELYPAEMFFGDMLTGTNYDDEEVRKTSGRNGMGAKATNVFSYEFTVECTNPKDKKKFTQIFTENAKHRTKPKLSNYNQKKGYTMIKFAPDYNYFKYPSAKNPGMDETFKSILKLYAYEVAMITGVLVKFIDHTYEPAITTNIRVNTLEKYVRLFYPDTKTHKLATIKAPNGDTCVIVEGDEPEDDTIPTIPHISFVNGIRTIKGGLHVEAWKNGIIPAFVRMFNTPKNKKEEKTKLKTTAKEVYPYLTIFIRAEADRPKFAEQTKETLTEVLNSKKKSVPYKLFNTRSKKEKDEWNRKLDVTLKKMMRWKFVRLLEEKLEAKRDRTEARKENKKISKGRITGIAKLTEANKAGTSQSHKCTLIITEGDSAKGMAKEGLSVIDGGQDFYGIFPVRGKFMNVRNKSIAVANANTEVAAIIEIMGFRRDVDYNIDKHWKSLRYGTIMTMADADDDGIQINGLIINFIHVNYPTFIEAKHVKSFSTAVVQATPKGTKSRNNIQKFYTNPDFKRWWKPEYTKKYNIVYLKGLGSILPVDYYDYFSNPKIVEYFLEGDEDDYMPLGFGSARIAKEKREESDRRKEWITRDMKKPKELESNSSSEYDSSSDEIILDESSSSSDEDSDEEDIVYEGELGLSTFVDRNLIIYHKMAIVRALPSVFDGLKEVQRKVLFGLKHENYTFPTKVSIAQSGISKIASYHHGETSMFDTITRLGSGFVGSNNVPLLVNAGAFGTRGEGGQDAAAARYLKTKLEDITKAIYRLEDEALLERLEDDGILVEYRHYMPVIPMVLVNGSQGIASGFSTNIAKYNPVTLCDWIENWLLDEPEEMDRLLPWYRGFTGEIDFKRNKNEKIIMKDGNPTGWISKGTLKKDTSKKGKFKGWWHIEELPVGFWTEKFKIYLESLMNPPLDTKTKKKKFKKALINFEEHHPANKVHFAIKPTKDFLPDMNTTNNFKNLQNSFSLLNMVALDENGYPIRFGSPEDILEFFCPRRLHYYGLRKEHLLFVFKKDLSIATNRYRYIKGIVDKKLNLHQEDEVLDKYLSSKPWKFTKIKTGKSNQPTFDYLLSMQTRSMTKRKLAELQKETEKLKKKIAELKSTSIKEMWRSDLKAFRVAYQKMLKTRVEGAQKPKRKRK